MSTDRFLSGRVALVTGGSGTIGGAIINSLCLAGARTISLDIVRRGRGDEVECDVSRAESVEAAVAEVKAKFGRADVAIHAAGIAADSVVWKLPVEEWDRVQSVNLRGAFLLMRAVIPIMREREGGRIVLIGSINGSRGKAGTAAYSASKAGLLGLARSVSREVGRFGITVNVVEPGWVRTPLTDRLPDELRDRARAETLLGELTEPDDVANAVSFLCGPGGRRITGQAIRVDAGQLVGG